MCAVGKKRGISSLRSRIPWSSCDVSKDFAAGLRANICAWMAGSPRFSVFFGRCLTCAWAAVIVEAGAQVFKFVCLKED